MSTVPNPPAASKVLLTVEEAAACLNLGHTSMFALIRSGQIASVRIGRSRRIPAAAVDAHAARLVAEQCDGSAAA
jgi:excisionase family DNA binding protein